MRMRSPNKVYRDEVAIIAKSNKIWGSRKTVCEPVPRYSGQPELIRWPDIVRKKCKNMADYSRYR